MSQKRRTLASSESLSEFMDTVNANDLDSRKLGIAPTFHFGDISVIMTSVHVHQALSSDTLAGLDPALFPSLMTLTYTFCPKTFKNGELIEGSVLAFIPLQVFDDIDITNEHQTADAIRLSRNNITGFRVYKEPDGPKRRVKIADDKMLHRIADKINCFFWKWDVEYATPKADRLLKKLENPDFVLKPEMTYEESEFKFSRKLTTVAESYIVERVSH